MQKSRLGIHYIVKTDIMNLIDFPDPEQICEGNLAAQKYYSAERQSRAQICRGHGDGQSPPNFVTPPWRRLVSEQNCA